MSNKRPTAASWDSDDELLNEDSAGIYAFHTEKDEILDEDALLASDDELVVEDQEPALEIMAEGDDLLDDDEPLDQPRGASAGYQPDHYEDDAHYGDDNSAADTSTMDMSGYTQHDTSQEEADTTVPDTDSESEAEDDDDKTRGRFKTERSDIISLGTSRSRTDIPDTLEITKEDADKINKYYVEKNDKKPVHRQGQGHGGQRNQRNNNNKNNNQQNQNIRQQPFQQRGPRNQFRPRGPRMNMNMNMRQQFPVRQQSHMFRNNAPLNLLANQPTNVIFPAPNQLRFPPNNMGTPQLGAPIMQQPLVNQLQQQQGFLPQAPVLSTPRHVPESKIHVNPHFQTSPTRPPVVRPAWEPHHIQRGPAPQPMPQSHAPEIRPNLQHQQRPSWTPQFPGEAPSVNMAQRFPSQPVRQRFPPHPTRSPLVQQHSSEMPHQLPQQQHQPQHQPQPQHLPPQQQQQQHLINRPYSGEQPPGLRDQDERISQPYSHNMSTNPQQVAPRDSMQQQMPPPSSYHQHNTHRNVPDFSTVGARLRHGFQPKIYPHMQDQLGGFSQMVNRESEDQGQPIQTLVNNKRQVQSSQPYPAASGPSTRPHGPGVSGPRPVNPRGPRPITPRGPQPGLTISRGPRPALNRPHLKTGPRHPQHRPQAPPMTPVPSAMPPPPSAAELEEMEKKRRRAARFSQPPPGAVGEKRLTLGKRSSLEGAVGPSPPKVRKTQSTGLLVKTVTQVPQVQAPVQIDDSEYSEERLEQMEKQRQLAAQIKVLKESHRLESAKKLADKRAQMIHGPAQQLAAATASKKPAPRVTVGQSAPVAHTPVLPQGALRNVPVGGVARNTDGQWWKKVRVRDAKTGAIKTKFIKVSAAEAQVNAARSVQGQGQQGDDSQGCGRGTGQTRGRGRGGVVGGRGRVNQNPGRGQSMSPMESLQRQLSQPEHNIPLIPSEPQHRVVKPLNQGQSVQVLSGPNKPQNPDFNIQPITLTGSRAGDSRPSDRRLVKRPGEGGQQNVNQPKRLVQPHRSVTTVIRDQTVNDKQRRVVLNGGGDAPAVTTDTVLLSGISSGTTEISIRHLAQKVGPVAGCQINRGSRNAILQFCDVQHAGLFAQRFNRTMLDLAMISVSLMEER